MFLREIYFNLDFAGLCAKVSYEVSHAKAKVEDVSLRREYEDGKLVREYMALSIRDEGRPTRPTKLKEVIIVRKGNEITPLPGDCGTLLRYLQPSADRYAYFVFASKAEPRDVGSKDAKTTESRPVAKAATTSGVHPVAGCPCVIDGTTAHAAPAETPAKSDGEGEPLPWWESPGEARSSGG